MGLGTGWRKGYNVGPKLIQEIGLEKSYNKHLRCPSRRPTTYGIDPRSIQEVGLETVISTE